MNNRASLLCRLVVAAGTSLPVACVLVAPQSALAAAPTTQAFFEGDLEAGNRLGLEQDAANCPAILNNDTFVDFTDFDDFVAAFESYC